MSGPSSDLLEAFDREGYAVVPELADEQTLASLSRAIEDAGAGESARRRGASGGAYAMRNLLDVAAVRAWATSDAVMTVIRTIAGDGARPVRGLLFDKTPEANWKVAYHQDRSIAVADRGDADVPGFGPWSTKAGVTHVQPPVELLERMITVRLHLDDCGPDNGPLRVVPASHRDGIPSSADVARLPRERGEHTCLVPRGGALLMRPLLLHASSPATNPRRRRVIHIEYSCEALPEPLRWHADAGVQDRAPAGQAQA
jgi:ectoine hydroxylase-related dioxygenase (phytanoyl-CoA dioxygenase family)